MQHIPVLLKETVDGLNIKPDGVYVDATVGGAGHSLCITRNLSPKGRLICIDRDEYALEISRKRLSPFNNITFVHSIFSDIKKVVLDCGFEEIDGALFDLGVSSFQIDDAERGFSYMHDAPLDMRMDRTQKLSAYEVVNGFSFEQLDDIIGRYGEEKFHSRVARGIVRFRMNSPITSTLQLASIIKSVLPAEVLHKGNPCKKTFQAIRIAVNNELDIIKSSILDAVDLLNPGGRVCVITFHSLEDRIVKNVFRELSQPCVCPRDFPVCVCGKKAVCKLVNRKPILPSVEELNANSRSHSAKLRIVEKI